MILSSEKVISIQESNRVISGNLETSKTATTETNRGRTYSYFPTSPYKLLKVAAVALLALFNPAAANHTPELRFKDLQARLCPSQPQQDYITFDQYGMIRPTSNYAETMFNDKLLKQEITCHDGTKFSLIDGKLEEDFLASTSGSKTIFREDLMPELGDLNEGDLVYDGDTKNGLAHGYGVYTLHGRVLFEGTWENGRPSKGKYHMYGSIEPFSFGDNSPIKNGHRVIEATFDKEFLMQGFGKQYSIDPDSPNGILMNYEGNFVNGKKHGRGKAYGASGKLAYEGTFSKGLVTGKGKLYTEEGLLKFDGDMVNGKKHGFGIGYDDKGVKDYEGQFKDGLSHGLGKVLNEQGTILYEGEFAFDKPHGHGKVFDLDGRLVYDGGFHEGEKHGKGLLYVGEGIFIDGNWKNGKQDGVVKMYYDDILIGISEWKDGQLISMERFE